MRSWCFDSQESGGVYDREYGSADIREVVYKIVGNGLFMDTDTSLQVAAGSGLTVKVQPGNCFINGAFGAADTAESFTFDASASGRYDIVVARFDLSLSYRSIRLAVIKGTEGSSAAATPTKTASVYDLQLAKVNIRAGASSILQSDITDTRTDTTVCGIVNGVSSQAAALQSQINDMGSAKQDKTNSLATEAALDDADTVPFYDASAGAHRKTLWSNIKAKLKAYLDTIYASISHTHSMYVQANPTGSCMLYHGAVDYIYFSTLGIVPTFVIIFATWESEEHHYEGASFLAKINTTSSMTWTPGQYAPECSVSVSFNDQRLEFTQNTGQQVEANIYIDVVAFK